ncbi:hypothetical protein RQM47_17155 [Rubrivirga sp. S365]|uniref:purine-cytosine permease family protein n=1 Tax=Rubrivirga sp. S365 TaxID=3076080 RepID=UPI0028C81726|nr:hypothetical protein [Rubrivirga sp. S365]MDT7858381.1 hypothetical protein [Rubrivirga sp. S365]
MSTEQAPVSDDELRSWPHFLGLYAAEHVAATEFVIGATFVALGARTGDILLGLLIGNVLAILSWTLITTPIAVDTRLSLYTYLGRIAGDSMTKLYNWANVVIFTVISAAMITVSATAVRFALDIPAQLDWYPTNGWFVLVVLAVGAVVVLVATFGFRTVSDFADICAPWLFTMFVSGALVLLPALAEAVIGTTVVGSWGDFLEIGSGSIWTGVTSDGEPGIGLLEVTGFAWAANTITHVGLIDMALLRFAKKKWYGLTTASGMLFGHYVAWIAAGIMGAGTGVILGQQIVELDPGDVAYYALGLSGFVIVIVAGWTTANANLYRAGLAAQAIFPRYTRERTTLVVGLATVVIACFPFVFSTILPLLVYAGLLVVPVGAIVFAEHQVFPRVGLSRYWAARRGLARNVPAIAAWGLGLALGAVLDVTGVISFYYIFVPVWLFTIVAYTAMAARAGARSADEAPGAEPVVTPEQAVEAARSDDGRAEEAPRDALATALRAVSVVALVVALAFAAVTLLGSPDTASYEANRDAFYTYGFVCTLVYFTTAYAAMRRRKATAHS